MERVTDALEKVNVIAEKFLGNFKSGYRRGDIQQAQTDRSAPKFSGGYLYSCWQANSNQHNFLRSLRLVLGIADEDHGLSQYCSYMTNGAEGM